MDIWWLADVQIRMEAFAAGSVTKDINKKDRELNIVKRFLAQIWCAGQEVLLCVRVRYVAVRKLEKPWTTKIVQECLLCTDQSKLSLDHSKRVCFKKQKLVTATVAVCGLVFSVMIVFFLATQLGPFIRGKIRRFLYKTTFRINGTFLLK